MTKSQLNSFFGHFNLEKDYSDDSILELKKLLLLELKSSTDDLLIDGKSWSRNDILTFFDQPLKVEFDIEAFYDKHPWTRHISDPESLLNQVADNAFVYEDLDFVLFRNVEAVQYELNFLRTIRKKMFARRYEAVVKMLKYLECFRRPFQFEVMDVLRSMMYTQLKTKYAEVESCKSEYKFDLIWFMDDQSYIDVMKRLGESDTGLAYLSIKLFNKGMKGGWPVSFVLKMFNKQRELNFCAEGEAFFNLIYEHLLDIKRRVEKGSDL